jgi:hypothetical protein
MVFNSGFNRKRHLFKLVIGFVSLLKYIAHSSTRPTLIETLFSL